MLVLDSSGSMAEKIGGDTKISMAKKALNRVVDGLPSAAQVGPRVYGAKVFDRLDKGACTDSQLGVPIGTDNRDALKGEIKKYRPYGETPIYCSWLRALPDTRSPITSNLRFGPTPRPGPAPPQPRVSGFVTYLAGRPFELLVREEPPVSSTRGLPPAESADRWQKMAPGVAWGVYLAVH